MSKEPSPDSYLAIRRGPTRDLFSGRSRHGKSVVGKGDPRRDSLAQTTLSTALPPRIPIWGSIET